LWQHQSTLDQLGIVALPISFQRLPASAFSTAGDRPPVDYYLDLEKSLYHHYGMFSAGFWDLWGPRTWLAYLKLLAKGQKLMKSEGDVEQRGGDVLIDPAGIIRLHHIGSGPGDRPDIETVLEMVKNFNAE
jgi:hypothetical protein